MRFCWPGSRFEPQDTLRVDLNAGLTRLLQSGNDPSQAERIASFSKVRGVVDGSVSDARNCHFLLIFPCKSTVSVTMFASGNLLAQYWRLIMVTLQKESVAVLGMTIFVLLCNPSPASQPEQNESSESEKTPENTFVPLRKVPPRKLTVEQKYVQSIQQAINLCQQSGGKTAECWSKATPAKCESLVYAALTEKGKKLRAWYLCASTCTNVRYWSRKFGECRTKLAPVADPE